MQTLSFSFLSLLSRSLNLCAPFPFIEGKWFNFTIVSELTGRKTVGYMQSLKHTHIQKKNI